VRIDRQKGAVRNGRPAEVLRGFRFLLAVQ
jgi:hypothetical protein